MLLLLVDDLRAAVGAYGDQRAQTPSIDALATDGLLFERAYASVATCSPSRTSLLTGMRPDRHRVYDLETHFRQTVPDALSLPQLFRAAGYVSLSYGKVFHESLDDPLAWTPAEELRRLGLVEPRSWRGTSATYPEDWVYMEYESEEGARPFPGRKFGRSTERSRRKLGWVDAKTATRACRALAPLARLAPPFFLAVGFVRPHLPFSAPEWAWAGHDGESFPRPQPSGPPSGASELTALSLARWGELRAYSGVPLRGALPPDRASHHRKAYYAAVTFADAQVGRVVAALRGGARANSTAVVLTSDHGWKLGEHGAWSKHTVFEVDTRVPLIVAPPRQGWGGHGAAGAAAARGVRTRAIVELIDLYPTLAAFAGLQPPRGQVDGVSLLPLLRAPATAPRFFAEDRLALSQWPLRTRAAPGDPEWPCMAYRLRTRQHSIVR